MNQLLLYILYYNTKGLNDLREVALKKRCFETFSILFYLISEPYYGTWHLLKQITDSCHYLNKKWMLISIEINVHLEANYMLQFQTCFFPTHTDACLHTCLWDLSLSPMSHQTFEEFHQCQLRTVCSIKWVQLWSYTSCNSVSGKLEMCIGWMAELYYGTNGLTATRAGKKFSKDVWKPIVGNAAQPLAAMK